MKINTIGIMTGNSLDAVDVVLTAFDENTIEDLKAFSFAYPDRLKQQFIELREHIKQYAATEDALNDPLFVQTVESYTRLAAEAVNHLVEISGLERTQIAALGFHGQTCDHFPPSIAGNGQPYTLQVGDARLLADLTGIPVIYDFRSDDIMNGGEGAPLAPLHNFHIAQMMAGRGHGAVAFCNGGNTGNIALITRTQDSEHPQVAGWDIGPFNHLADLLMREYKKLPFDKDGQFGAEGTVRPDLLSRLFNQAAVTGEGENFYHQLPPKSSDPHWYKLVYDESYSFADNLRTVEYLSAYSYVYNLRYVHPQLMLPSLYLLFGGGWKNPLVRQDFENLLHRQGEVLPEHRMIFADIFARLPDNPTVDFAGAFGFSGEYMEARIFADMAYCKIINQPFSLPSTTGCRIPTVGGVYVLPSQNEPYLLTELLRQYDNPAQPEQTPKLWSRAAKGWQNLTSATGQNI